MNLSLSSDPLCPSQRLRHTYTSSFHNLPKLQSLLSLCQHLMQPNRLLKFACPLREQGCSRRFRSQAGRTYHIRTCHTNNNVVTPLGSPSPETPEPVPPPLDGSNPNTPIPDDDTPRPPSPEHSPPCPGPAQPKKNYHPWLTGKQCFFIATYPRPFDFVIYKFQEGLVMNTVNFYLREHHLLPGLTQAQTTGIHLRMRCNF